MKSGQVLEFKRKKAEPTLAERMERIRESMNRIERIIKELQALQKEDKCH